jgi:hypothetical protein
MLSILECRKFIPDNMKYTDEEIIRIRDDLYILAEIALETVLEKREKDGTKNVYE